MYLIDTNIFLEILLEQSKTSDCEKLLEKIRKGEVKGYLSSFALHSIEVILSGCGKTSALEMFLEDLMVFANIEIIYTNIMDELKAVKFMRPLKLDFDDAIQYYIAKTRSLILVSFDKDFDKTDIKRIEPQNIA